MTLDLKVLVTLSTLSLGVLGFNEGCDRRDGGEPSAMSGGSVIVPDTPSLWNEFVTVTNLHISDEKSGEAPPGGVASWAKHWRATVRELRSARENHEKYVDYIIAGRERAGLPPLVDDDRKSGE